VVEETRNTCNNSVGRHVVKRPHGRPSRTWKVNIKMELKEVSIFSLSCFGVSCVDRSGSATVVLALLIIIIIIIIIR
jgi:hypothetical protein